MPRQHRLTTRQDSMLDRYGLAFGIAFGAVVLLLAYFFLIAPLVTELRSDATSKRAAKQDELVQAQNRVRSLQAVRDKLENITPAELSRMEVLLPESVNIPLILQDMDAMIRDSGMSVANMSVVEAATESASAAVTSEDSVRAASNVLVQAVDIQLSLTTGGDYTTYKKLLQIIEEHNPYIEMNSLTFQPGTEQLSLSLRTYYYQ